MTTPAKPLRIFGQVDLVLVAVDVVHVQLVLPLVGHPVIELENIITQSLLFVYYTESDIL